MGTGPAIGERGTLAPLEPHPAAVTALAWLRDQKPETLLIWMESFASVAIEGNRLAEVCGATLARVLEGDTVSDRYLLGLVYAMRFDEAPPGAGGAG